MWPEKKFIANIPHTPIYEKLNYDCDIRITTTTPIQNSILILLRNYLNNENVNHV